MEQWLAEPFCGEALRADIVAAVDHLDEISVADLTGLLGAASPSAQRPRSKPGSDGDRARPLAWHAARGR